MFSRNTHIIRHLFFFLFCCFNSVHYVKNPGAVLEPGSVVAKLELDDPSKVTQVFSIFFFFFFQSF